MIEITLEGKETVVVLNQKFKMTTVDAQNIVDGWEGVHPQHYDTLGFTPEKVQAFKELADGLKATLA
ncbi:MAG: hypothetical protein GY799_12345 [Desulfobulbaceae bacterium]|nr:hypothetical protein [Desulfobulbaceae bacterium]